MKEPIQYIGPVRHWSWDASKDIRRTHRQQCLTAARKGITLEELEKRQAIAKDLRVARRIDEALGAALYQAATGCKPEIRKVKRITVEVTAKVTIDFESEGW